MERELKRLQQLVNDKLGVCLSETASQQKLLDAMNYSLMAGGKRIRPALVLAFCKAAGGDEAKALNAACAVEMLHTYSLIHDDLPCMDDDELRRGVPTNHIVFGECLATLAGDALQAEAFYMVMTSDLPADRVAGMGRILADAAGWRGMCGGQTLDMEGEGKALSIEELKDIHNKKTAAMLIASAKMGVCAAGGSDEAMAAAEKYAAALGMAFQVRDDILDTIGDEQTLGKPIGSDAENDKYTFVSLCGLEACEEIVKSETQKAVDALSGVFEDTEFLVWLAYKLAERNY